tara:strand:- start:421 stop:759 length:339 start_codon:yes stop_codon:yes gene_type:complete
MFKQRVGSKRQVWNGTARETPGGLRKSALFQDKNGNIKSKKASKSAKKTKNLKRAGWTFKKGTFGAVRIEEKKKRGSTKRKSSKRKSSKRKSSKRKSKRRSQKGGQGCTYKP